MIQQTAGMVTRWSFGRHLRALLAEHEADDEADAHRGENGTGGIFANPMFALAAEALGAGAGVGVGCLGLAAQFLHLALGGGAQFGGLGLGGGAQILDGWRRRESCRRIQFRREASAEEALSGMGSSDMVCCVLWIDGWCQC